MIRRISKSISLAVKIAFISFNKSFRSNEDIDSIMGYIDPLTNIPNRRAFYRDRNKYKNEYALVMIDVDKFKNINDSLGYAQGDSVLRRLATILEETVGSTGTVYRIGGDEFVLIVQKSKVLQICREIRRNIRKEDSFTISQGVVTESEDLVTEENLSCAHSALSYSKINGRNQITTAIPAVA